MRVDTTDAVEMFEMLGWAAKEAGVGKYGGFLLVEAIRGKGFRLVLERLPVEAEQAETALSFKPEPEPAAV